MMKKIITLVGKRMSIFGSTLELIKKN